MRRKHLSGVSRTRTERNLKVSLEQGRGVLVWKCCGEQLEVRGQTDEGLLRHHTWMGHKRRGAGEMHDG